MNPTTALSVDPNFPCPWCGAIVPAEHDDSDECPTCDGLFCPDCGARVTYDEKTNTYTHFGPACFMAENLGEIIAPRSTLDRVRLLKAVTGEDWTVVGARHPGAACESCGHRRDETYYCPATNYAFCPECVDSQIKMQADANRE